VPSKDEQLKALALFLADHSAMREDGDEIPEPSRFEFDGSDPSATPQPLPT